MGEGERERKRGKKVKRGIERESLQVKARGRLAANNDTTNTRVLIVHLCSSRGTRYLCCDTPWLRKSGLHPAKVRVLILKTCPQQWGHYDDRSQSHSYGAPAFPSALSRFSPPLPDGQFCCRLTLVMSSVASQYDATSEKRTWRTSERERERERDRERERERKREIGTEVLSDDFTDKIDAVAYDDAYDFPHCASSVMAKRGQPILDNLLVLHGVTYCIDEIP